MRLAYIDCVSGVAGDMLLGALVDAGLPLAELRADVAALRLPGLDVSATRVHRGALAATQARVTVAGRPADDHAAPHRHPGEMLAVIERATLPAPVRARAGAVIRRLAEAEAAVHGTTPDHVHFHELGAWDTLADVVGTVAGLHRLGVEEVVVSPVPTGRGTITTAHGPLPVPAPAVTQLLRGAPLLDPPVEGELTTPTGAALVATLAARFGPRPPLVLRAVGHGAGTRELPGVPNVVRLFLGDAAAPGAADVVTVLETNLDDCTPQACGYLAEACLAAGALDVTLTPTQMKKGRPGVIVQVLAAAGTEGAVEAVLFRESTTFGVRRWTAERTVLDRESLAVETPYGTVRVKIGRRAGAVVRVAPESDDVRAAAQRAAAPLADVAEAARAAARRALGLPAG